MDMMTAGTVIIRSKKPSVFPAVFLLKMLKWIIIRSKKKWREFLKKMGKFLHSNYVMGTENMEILKVVIADDEVRICQLIQALTELSLNSRRATAISLPWRQIRLWRRPVRIF